MALVFIIASILGQSIALAHALRMAWRQRRPGWIMVAIAVGLMLGRRCITLYFSQTAGRDLDSVTELVALLISVSLAIGLSWLLYWEEPPPAASGTESEQVSAPMARLKRQALLLGLLALCSMTVLVYVTYAENRGNLAWVLGFASILIVVLPLSLALLFRVSSIAQASAVAAVNRQHRAEKVLQQDEHAYRTLVETSRDLIWSMDAQGRMTFVNAAVLWIFGYQPDEMLGHPFTDFQPPERAAKDLMTFGRIMAGETFTNYETTARHKNGATVWLSINVIALRNPAGVFLGATGTAQDITERKKSEIALRESEERHRRIVETAGEGIWQIDAQSRTSFVNPKMAELLGYTVAEMQGRGVMDFVDAAWQASAENHIERRKQGIAEQHDFKFSKKDGTEFWGSLATSPIVDARGVYAGALAMVTDITERNRTVEALRQSEERFRLVLDHSPDAIVLLDLATGKFSMVNPAAEKLFKLPAAELCRVGPIEMSPPLQPDGVPSGEKARQFIAQALAGETPVFDWMHRDAHGHDMQCEVGLLRLMLSDREVVRGNITEISRRKEAEIAIRESEAKFHAVFAQSPLAIVLTDLPACRVVDANAAAEVLLGRKLAAMRGMSSLELTVWTDPAEHDQYLQLLVGNGAAHEFEARLRRGDGAERRVVYNGRLVHFGSQDYVLNSLIDVTERKQVEEELHQNREQFIDLFDNAPVGYHEVDSAGRFTRVNKTELKMLGYQAEELLGQPVWSINAEEDASRKEILAKLGGTRPASLTFERRFRRKDGSQLPVLIEDKILCDSDGVITGIRSVVQDITERKRAEEKAQHLANFPELNPNPVLEFTADGTLSYHNPAALSMAQRVGFANLADLLPPQSKQIVADCLASGQPQLRLETRHGENTLSWSYYPIGAQQVVHCYVGDITKRLQLEEQFRQAQKMEAIGQLSGGVAHDFNNLLTVILGNLGLLQSSREVAAEVAEPLQAIGHAANRAANLTRQLLAFSRQQVMQQENLDLNAVVGHISKMLRRVIGEAVRIRLDYALQALPIHADQGMLEQVILNLCINARDAMPQGGQLTLRTAAIDISEEEARLMVAARAGSFAMLIVTDTGIGIAPENMKRVFEPFFTTKEVGKGTGLGLASVYGIAQQHNGWVTVESEVQRGTTFTVYLPLLAAPIASGSSTAQNEKIPGGTETILLVEDDIAVQTVTKITLIRLGYQVLVASNGHQALRIWQEKKSQIQLVLTDMIMPEGLSGKDIARRFKDDLPGIRIIFMSGYSADIAGTDFAPEEGDYFLGKPFEMHALATMIRKSLDTLRLSAARPGIGPRVV